MASAQKYSLISLGCSKNLVDSEVFCAITERAGYSYTQNLGEANLIFVNTCGFIDDAKKEAVDTIFEVLEYKKSGACNKVIVTGCFVHRYFEEIKKDIPEIDHLVDLKNFSDFAKIVGVEATSERKILTLPHTVYLRIADGCDNLCSYCTIPFIRGEQKSEPIEFLVDEAQKLVSNGVKEITLTAQDTTNYGVDIYGKASLPKLLVQLAKIEKLRWIRVLYLHPDHLTNQIIETIQALPKVCNYFEMPIQHISTRVLKLMNREKDKHQIERIIQKIRQNNSTIRTTLMCGFPSETEADFEQLYEFVKRVKFDRLGVFAYSPQEDTPAYRLNSQVSKAVAETRRQKLMDVQKNISQKKLKGFVGRIIEVIVDTKVSKEVGSYIGRSRFDAPDIDGVVYLKGEWQVGEITKCLVVDSTDYDLYGVKP